MDEKNDLDSAELKEAKVNFGKRLFPAFRKTMSFKELALGLSFTAIGIAALFRTEAPKPKSEGISSPDSNLVQSDGSTQVELESYPSTKKTHSKPQAIGPKLRGLESIERPWNVAPTPGSTLRAVLSSGASNGIVKAVVKEALRVGGETYLPEGASLLGNGQSTEDRLFISFSKAIKRDGKVAEISAHAIDSKDQQLGLKGSKVGRYATKLAGAIGLNFVAGMAEGLQQKEAIGQQTVTKANAKNALLNGASHASLELANETMGSLKNQTPVIEVESGREILVIFE